MVYVIIFVGLETAVPYSWLGVDGLSHHLRKDSTERGAMAATVEILVNVLQIANMEPYGGFLNKGTPKSSILILLSTINQPFWGSPFISMYGNLHMEPTPVNDYFS